MKDLIPDIIVLTGFSIAIILTAVALAQTIDFIFYP